MNNFNNFYSSTGFWTDELRKQFKQQINLNELVDLSLLLEPKIKLDGLSKSLPEYQSINISKSLVSLNQQTSLKELTESLLLPKQQINELINSSLVLLEQRSLILKEFSALIEAQTHNSFSKIKQKTIKSIPCAAID